VNRPGSGSFLIVSRTLTMFCGLQGVSRSFDARKIEPVIVSLPIRPSVIENLIPGGHVV
jgi:hypothetical protein